MKIPQEPSSKKTNQESQNSPENNKPRGMGFVFLVVFMLVLLGLFAFNSSSLMGSSEKLSSAKFMKTLIQGDIKSITVTGPSAEGSPYEVQGEYRDGRSASKPANFTAEVGEEDAKRIPDICREAGVEYDYEASSTLFSTLLLNLLPFLLIGLLIWFLFLRRGVGGVGGPGGIFSFGQSRAKVFSKEDAKVRFSDVAGVDEAKEELSEIVEFLKNPERFTRIGAKIPRGVVMFGPPGCGKTLLAKAVAGEADRPFFSISGSDFVEMFVGVGAARVRDLFKTARENSPCIVFVDEIDAVGRKRGTGLGGGHDEREQTLNAILVEMDGISTDEGLIVVAATNRPDVLDPALLRPGRFDRQVVIDLPDAKGRGMIFKVHLTKVKAAENLDVDELAAATPGFSGADIANLVNEAALAAALANRSLVQMADLLEARDKIRFGRQKKSRIMEDDERKVIAYHEAGHAVVQYFTDQTDPVHKVTIIPRGMALGATMSLPEKDRHLMSVERAEQTLEILYGGRIAEAKFIGTISSGASNDIERATELATEMVVRYGFSEALGPINYAEIEERDFLGSGMTKVKGHSDKTAALIDSEIQRLLQTAYKRAEDMIAREQEKLELLAQALLTYETLDAKDVDWIMKGKPIKEKRDLDDENKKRQEAAEKLAEAEALKRSQRSSSEQSGGGLRSTSPNPA